MNHSNHPQQPHDDVISVLKALRPAASKIDPSTVFYQAGFQAGRENRAADRGSQTGLYLLAMFASAVVTAAVTGPTSYRIGQSAGQNTVSPGATELAKDVPRESTTIESNRERASIKTRNEAISPIIDDDPASLLARWMNRWQPFREKTQRDDQPETLSVMDASRLSRTEALQSWPELAFPENVLKRNEQELRAASAHIAGAMQRTLAVRDTNLWAQVLEVSR